MPPPFQGGGLACVRLIGQYPTLLSIKVKTRGSFGRRGWEGILRDDQPRASLHLGKAEALESFPIALIF
jgi:hypothetical protein